MNKRHVFGVLRSVFLVAFLCAVSVGLSYGADERSVSNVLLDQAREIIGEAEKEFHSRHKGCIIDYSLTLYEGMDKEKEPFALEKVVTMKGHLLYDGKSWRETIANHPVMILGNAGKQDRTLDNTLTDTYHNLERTTLTGVGSASDRPGDCHYTATVGTKDPGARLLSYRTFLTDLFGGDMSDFLEQSRDKVISIVLNEGCFVVTLEGRVAGEERRVLTIDLVKNCQVTRYRSYRDAAKEIPFEDISRDFQEVATGLWMPRSGQYTWHDESGKPVRRLVLEPIDFSTLEFGKEFVDADFEVVFPVGTVVSDIATGKKWIAGGEETVIQDVTKELDNVVPDASPARDRMAAQVGGAKGVGDRKKPSVSIPRPVNSTRPEVSMNDPKSEIWLTVFIAASCIAMVSGLVVALRKKQRSTTP